MSIGQASVSTRPVIIGMADVKVSGNPDETLITYALGSCLGIVLHDPIAKVAGLLHVMLPSSQIDDAKAKAQPAMFVDTGVPLLFRECYRVGARKERMTVTVAEGHSPAAPTRRIRSRSASATCSPCASCSGRMAC